MVLVVVMLGQDRGAPMFHKQRSHLLGLQRALVAAKQYYEPK